MILATANKEGVPSTRTVLLKGITEDGCLFFTHSMSRKAREIQENPFVAATLYWRLFERQLSFAGKAEPVSQEESGRYFLSRPRGNQLAAWASTQDQPISSRESLEKQWHFYAEKFANQAIPVPPHWVGFCIYPIRFEFWQGGVHRLHDRFQYTYEKGQWVLERLSP